MQKRGTTLVINTPKRTQTTIETENTKTTSNDNRHARNKYINREINGALMGENTARPERKPLKTTYPFENKDVLRK